MSQGFCGGEVGGGGGVKKICVLKSVRKTLKMVLKCCISRMESNASDEKRFQEEMCVTTFLLGGGGRGRGGRKLWVLTSVPKTFKMVPKRCIFRMESNAIDEKRFQEEKCVTRFFLGGGG